MSAYTELLADLEAEYQSLLALLRPLDEAAWDLATPAEGWAVRDQISHLAYFDDAAREAVTDGDAFLVFVADAIEKGGDPMEEHLVRGRAISGSAVLAWFEQAHEGLSGALDGLDPSARVPWFGPAMGVMSFVSARLMETWAHGQDVADALGAERTPTARLRHIAHLGVRARPYSYVVRGLDVPAGRIDVVLVGPDGDEWSWVVGEDGGSGDEGEGDRPIEVGVSGPDELHPLAALVVHHVDARRARAPRPDAASRGARKRCTAAGAGGDGFVRWSHGLDR